MSQEHLNLPSGNISGITIFQNSATAYGEKSTANVFNLQRPPKDTLPPKPWNTLPKSKNFIGRQKLLNDIQEKLNNSNESLVLMVCHGLGGVGKTQLARQFLEKYHTEYKDSICWFQGDKLQSDYIKLGYELDLFSNDNFPVEIKISKVKSWLENHPGWLLIYDNVEKYEDIQSLLPTQGKGKILITSRHTEWPYEKISVDVFTPDEAREYIQTITGIKNELEEAEQLIKLLGALPLALAQACAYIKEISSIKEYLSLYRDIKNELLQENLLSSGDNYKSVAVTWNITLKKMQEECPDAVLLLYYSAYFHNEKIPLYLLENLFFAKNKPSLIFKCNKVKRIAKMYSMINVDVENKCFSLHCLVQEVIKIQLAQDKKFNYLHKSIDAIIKTFNLYNKRELLPHLESLLENIDKNKEVAIEPIKLETILLYLKDTYGRCDAKNQTKILARLLSIQFELLNKGNFLKYTATLGGLGNSYACLGREDKKIKYFKKVLDILEKYNAFFTIEGARACWELANAYDAMGEIKKSQDMLEKAKSILEKNRDDPKNYSLLININVFEGFSYIFYGENKEDFNRGINILNENLKLEENDMENKNREYNVAIINYYLAVGYQKLEIYDTSKNHYNKALNSLEKDNFKDHQLAKVYSHFSYLHSDLENYPEQKKYLLKALEVQEIYYEPCHKEIELTKSKLNKLDPNLSDIEKKKVHVEYDRENNFKQGLFINSTKLQKRNLNGDKNNLLRKDKKKEFEIDLSGNNVRRSMSNPR